MSIESDVELAKKIALIAENGVRALEKHYLAEYGESPPFSIVLHIGQNGAAHACNCDENKAQANIAGLVEAWHEADFCSDSPEHRGKTH